MKFKFKIQQYQSDEVDNTPSALSNIVSLPYENA